MRRIRARLAFTLIELLAVIAIIAILAGLLFPFLIGASARSKRAKCLSNLRQWGSSLNLYLVDSGGIMPGQGSVAGGSQADPLSTNRAWFNVMAPYASQFAMSNLWARREMPRPRDNSLFICPAAEYERTIDPSDGRTFYCNYPLNLWVEAANRGRSSYDEKDARFSTFLRLSQLPNTSIFPMWTDGPTGPGPDGGVGYLYAHTHAYYMGFPTEGDAFRHDGSANISFADGHASSFAKAEIYTSGMNQFWNYGGIQWNPVNPNLNGP